MSPLTRRQALRLLGAAGAAGVLPPALSACTSGSTNAGSLTSNAGAVKIGLILPQSGQNRALSYDIDNGFRLFLRDSSGRLGGRRVELIAADESEATDTAKAAVERMLQENVTAICGVSTAAGLAAVKDTIEGGQVPLLTPSPALPSMLGAKYIWRTSFTTDEPGRALAKWIADHLDGRLAVMAGDGPGVREDVKAFVQAFKAAGGVLTGEPVITDAASKEYTPALNAFRAANPHALYAAYTGAPGVEFVRQLRASTLPSTLQVYAPGMLTEGAQLTSQGDAARGIFTSLNYSADINTVVNRQFVSDYNKTYGTIPTTYAVAAYDAAAILDRAFTIAGNDVSPFGVNTAIGRLGQVDSPRGPWQFNQNRTPLQNWFLRQVKDDGPVLANVVTADLVALG